MPGGTANTTENRINIQQVSEKLEKGQESIEWGLIKINEKQFTRERPNLKGKRSARQKIVGLESLIQKSAKAIVVNKFYTDL